MKPIVDHIQITVCDFAESVEFYDKLMPLLGFELSRKGGGRVEEHEFDVVEYVHDNITIGFNSPREALRSEKVHRRRPGALHHLAFRAESRQEIDQLYPSIIATGAEIVNPPQVYPQHGEHYYALFFKDPSGIKLEIMYEGE